MILQLISNEIKIAEKILNGEDVDIKTGRKVVILAKYFLLHVKHDKKKTKELLHAYLESITVGNYIWEMKERYLIRLIDDIYKNGSMVSIDSVEVYKSEIDVINAENDAKGRRILFTFLVEAKLKAKIRGVESYWTSSDLATINKIANVKRSSNQRVMDIYNLSQGGYIKPSRKLGSDGIEVLFAKSEGEIVYTVQSFDDLGLQYDKYILGNNKIIECSECGKLVEVKSNRTTYCAECSREKQLEYQRKSMKKLRCEVLENRHNT